MNNIVNLQTLVAELSKITSTDEAFIEKFIRTLIDCISDNLTEGRQCEVPGIGVFGIETIGNQTNIIWQPDTVLADDVNAPFSSFEPVTIAPDITMDMLDKAPQSEIAVDNTSVQTDTSSTEEEEVPPAIAAPSLPTESEPEIKEPEQTEDETEQIAADLQQPTVTAEEDNNESDCNYNYDYDYLDEDQRSGSGWWMIFIVIVSVAIGYLCATYLPNPLLYTPATHEKDITEKEDTIQTITDIVATDSATTYSQEAPVTTPAQTTVVTDTVKQGRFLATMARKHYGSYKFWIYIYKENADHIPNPDNLPVGTVLTIPSAEKYSIDSHDPASISRAEAEIRRLENN
ncbi:MAG: hypothetical protein K2M98_04190 [Muribaculum sp.]|nr:hypothetical protein [Muribaculum sp.]